MKYAVAISLLLPFTGWSAAFLIIYGTQAIGCAAGWQHVEIGGISLIRIVLVSMFAAMTVSVAVGSKIAMTVLRRSGEEVGIVKDVVFYTAIAATLSTAFVFIGVFWLQLC